MVEHQGYGTREQESSVQGDIERSAFGNREKTKEWILMANKDVPPQTLPQLNVSLTKRVW